MAKETRLVTVPPRPPVPVQRDPLAAAPMIPLIVLGNTPEGSAERFAAAKANLEKFQP